LVVKAKEVFKMSTFQYEALDSQGVGIKDEIEALSQKEAISKIRNMGYFPTKVRMRGAAKKAAKGVLKPKSRRGAGGKVRVRVVTQFARQLSTLQDAGLCLLYTSPSPRDRTRSRMPSSA